ncbi:hypothetical protein GGF43_006271, partial [Coemansia sp. RSA 2618]
MSATDDIELQEIPQNAHEWSYSGEGNAKMVFAYTGSVPELRGWLLRLEKSASTSTPTALDAELRRQHDTTVFSTQVIGSLLGRAYILQQRLVRVTRAFLADLGSRARAQRPAHRTHQQIDPQQRVGVLMPNMLQSSLDANTSTVTVELKPKWGFLPTSPAIARGNQVKRRVCRYCMHQCLKQSSAPPSHFCPLDLFSASQARIAHALGCLERSPQNNMRVFVDGVLVSSDCGVDVGRVPQWDALKNAVARILGEEQVLVRLAELQRALDPLDIEGVFPVYRRAVDVGEMADSEPTLGDWVQAADAFHRRTQVPGDDRSGDQQTECPLSSDKQKVLEFLLSTVLKDVSAMIMVKQWPPHQPSDELP